jgi:hypothetical protein
MTKAGTRGVSGADWDGKRGGGRPSADEGGSQRRGGAQMEMMMTRMAKAFIMGKMDAEHARMRRTSLPQRWRGLEEGWVKMAGSGGFKGVEWRCV